MSPQPTAPRKHRRSCSRRPGSGSQVHDAARKLRGQPPGSPQAHMTRSASTCGRRPQHRLRDHRAARRRGFYRSVDRGELERRIPTSRRAGPHYYQRDRGIAPRPDSSTRWTSSSTSPVTAAPPSPNSAPAARSTATTTHCGSTPPMAAICLPAPTRASTRPSTGHDWRHFPNCPCPSSTSSRSTTRAVHTTDRRRTCTARAVPARGT